MIFLQRSLVGTRIFLSMVPPVVDVCLTATAYRYLTYPMCSLKQVFKQRMVPSLSQVRTPLYTFAVPPSWKVGQIGDLAVTVYVIADFDSPDGLELARESLIFMVFVIYFGLGTVLIVTFLGIDTLCQNSSNLHSQL